jgi:hypothetical protein
MILGGVIYLHSIEDKRMKDTTREYLDMFWEARARFVLGTTNWGEVDEKVGKIREEQLAKTWSGMTDSGSRLLRFDLTEKSARTFLDTILGQLIFGGNEDLKEEQQISFPRKNNRKKRKKLYVVSSYNNING